MAQRGARPSIPFRRHPNFALDGIGRRLRGAQAEWAQRSASDSVCPAICMTTRLLGIAFETTLVLLRAEAGQKVGHLQVPRDPQYLAPASRGGQGRPRSFDGPCTNDSTQVPCFGARRGRGVVRRFASVQPRRCVLPTSVRRVPEVGLSHTIGRSHDHGASVPALPLPMASRPHSTSGGSGSRDVCSSGSCQGTVLGRFMGRTAAAATTPTAVQPLRRLLG